MRNTIDLRYLPHNSSPKASRRLRHSLFVLRFGSPEPWRDRRFWREPVFVRSESRAERRRRAAHDKLAAVNLARLVRSADLSAAALTSTRASVTTPTPATRKITGAVRRGLSRGKQA